MSKGSNYYGGFFWVALISFIVPLFVGWKAFENVRPTTKPTPQLDASGVDHGVWDYLLKSYVSAGLIDYEGMKKDYLFREYIRQLGACDPGCLETEDEKLALACNAYNALVINGVISHKISDTVQGHFVKGFESASPKAKRYRRTPPVSSASRSTSSPVKPSASTTSNTT